VKLGCAKVVLQRHPLLAINFTYRSAALDVPRGMRIIVCFHLMNELCSCQYRAAKERGRIHGDEPHSVAMQWAKRDGFQDQHVQWALQQTDLFTKSLSLRV
jgi:hypothetical protein